MHHRSLGREVLRRAGYGNYPNHREETNEGEYWHNCGKGSNQTQEYSGTLDTSEFTGKQGSVSVGMDEKETRVHAVGQPHVMIGLSENDAGLKRRLGGNGENGPVGLIAEKVNNPIEIRGEVGELAAHPENPLSKNARNVVGGGAVK